MICPVCRQDMIVVEYRQIEIDYCHKCSGIWFDEGELELLLKTTSLGDTGLPSLEGLAKEKRSHGERKCPICRKKMKEVPLGEPAIHIDVCRRGDGIWFDGGELQELLKQVTPGPLANQAAMQQIKAFLGDTFKDEKSANSGA
jgi:Zn-finger nucleic acid-binding protein